MSEFFTAVREMLSPLKTYVGSWISVSLFPNHINCNVVIFTRKQPHHWTRWFLNSLRWRYSFGGQ